MNAADKGLLEEFPWLTEADLKSLERRPALVAFLEDDDESLDAAVERHRAVQKEARIQLRKSGKEPHKRMVVRGGIQTTAFEDPIEREMK